MPAFSRFAAIAFYGRLGQNTLRAIDRHMRDQYLPAAIRLQLLCDLRGRVDETAVRRALALVVDHHDAETSPYSTAYQRFGSLCGRSKMLPETSPSLSPIYSWLPSAWTSAVPFSFSLIDHGKEALPVFKLGDIVDCVAGLDAEVIAARAQLLQRAFQIGSTARLNIAEDEEIRRLPVGSAVVKWKTSDHVVPSPT